MGVYIFSNTSEGFQKAVTGFCTPCWSPGVSQVPQGYFLVMHFETFDLFGAIKLVNALPPRPGWCPSRDCLNPARRDNWRGKREWKRWCSLMSLLLFGKYCEWVCWLGNKAPEQPGMCRAAAALAGQTRAGRAQVCPTQGAPDVAFYCCQSLTVTLSLWHSLFGWNSDFRKEKNEKKITIYMYYTGFVDGVNTYIHNINVYRRNICKYLSNKYFYL